MIATDPFNTEEPISKRGMATYNAIAARLSGLNPKIFINQHIAAKEAVGKTGYSTLVAHDSTLDGIDFKADDPERLARAFDNAIDSFGQPFFASIALDPDHYALRKSFAATKGTGWREIWRPDPYMSPSEVPTSPDSTPRNLGMRFGSAGHPFRFTALHCAVANGICNVHIDQTGFVLGTPKGFTLTFDMFGHIINELKWKTDFFKYLDKKIHGETAKKILRETVRRVSINFPSAANGYQGLSSRINSFRRPQVPSDLLLGLARIAMPTGVTVDLYDNKYFTTQATVGWADNDFTVTLSLGGDW